MLTRSLRRSVLLVTSFALLAGLGCGQKAHTIDPQKEGVVTVNEVNIQDFNSAATVLTQKMLNSVNFQEELKRIAAKTPDGEKPQIFVSKIKNNTRQKFSSGHMLAGPIEEALQESGKVEFTSEDENARDTAKGHELLEGGSPRLPDLTLHGWIEELPTQAGRTKQNTYIFHLKLSGARGTTIWQGQEQITKQGARPAVGV